MPSAIARRALRGPRPLPDAGPSRGLVFATDAQVLTFCRRARRRSAGTAPRRSGSLWIRGPGLRGADAASYRGLPTREVHSTRIDFLGVGGAGPREITCRQGRTARSSDNVWPRRVRARALERELIRSRALPSRAELPDAVFSTDVDGNFTLISAQSAADGYHAVDHRQHFGHVAARSSRRRAAAGKFSRDPTRRPRLPNPALRDGPGPGRVRAVGSRSMVVRGHPGAESDVSDQVRSSVSCVPGGRAGAGEDARTRPRMNTCHPGAGSR